MPVEDVPKHVGRRLLIGNVRRRPQLSGNVGLEILGAGIQHVKLQSRLAPLLRVAFEGPAHGPQQALAIVTAYNIGALVRVGSLFQVTNSQPAIVRLAVSSVSDFVTPNSPVIMSPP